MTNRRDSEFPEKPSLEDFGITEESYKQVPDFGGNGNELVWFSIWIALSVCLFLITDWRWISIIVFSIVFGGAISAGIYFVGFAGLKWWKVNFIKGYKESIKYDAAIEEYKDSVKKYFDQRLTGLGVAHERSSTLEEHHENNLAIIGAFGRVLEDVSTRNATVVSTDLLRMPKEQIRGALLDEIFARLVCGRTERLDALEAGLIQLATFQSVDRPIIKDPIAELTEAHEAARRKGLDVPAEVLVRAIANATDGQEGAKHEALQKLMSNEQESALKLLKELRLLSKEVRELDESRVWQYQRYFAEPAGR